MTRFSPPLAVWAIILLVSACTWGCTDLDPDYVSHPTKPLYYSCTSSDDCQEGFACAVGTVMVPTEDGWVLRGVCVSGVNPDATGCPSGFLEHRVVNPSVGLTEGCQFPFQCPDDDDAPPGVEVSGDAISCPLGFRCPPNEPNCEACVFTSCDMTEYGGTSAKMHGLTTASDACLQASADTAPFADTAAGRVFCALEDASTDIYRGCPAGWTQLPSEQLPEGCSSSVMAVCYLTASMVGTWPGGDGLQVSLGPVVGAPLMLAPRGSARSCRPLP